MAEFTGERVIPGQVDIDLLNEHLARYTFAARLARGKRVLDAGCGAGYGSAELAAAAESVVGLDCAHEAVAFARAHYAQPHLEFLQASCSALPCRDGAFDLIVAFEVIEHLEDWRDFLAEARRALAPNGQFIVSTPNKLYYTESRGASGANPFHVHEFEFAEFRAALEAVFPHVSLFLENHAEAVTFQPLAGREPQEPGGMVEVRVDSAGAAADESHFFLAVCARRPQIGNPTFVYVPRAANVLRERERHIALLAGELETKNRWLEQCLREHEELMAQFAAQARDLARSNEWAERLDGEIAERGARIVELQAEIAAAHSSYQRKIGELEADIRAKTQWARDVETALTAEVRKQTADLVAAVEALHRTERELEDRTGWALALEKEARELNAQLAAVRLSRWVRLGRKIGFGPPLAE